MFTESSHDLKVFVNSKEILTTSSSFKNIDDFFESKPRKKHKTKTYLRNSEIVVKKINYFDQKETILSISFTSKQTARRFYKNKLIKGKANDKKIKYTVPQFLVHHRGDDLINHLKDVGLINSFSRGCIGGGNFEYHQQNV